MYNAIARDVARWRFDEIATPQQQTTAARHASEVWDRALQQAASFLPDDPVTAAGRLHAVRAELQEAAARREPGAVEWRGYADWLLEQAETARDQWLAQARAREQRFRERESRDSRTDLEALRRSSILA